MSMEKVPAAIRPLNPSEEGRLRVHLLRGVQPAILRSIQPTNNRDYHRVFAVTACSISGYGTPFKLCAFCGIQGQFLAIWVSSRAIETENRSLEARKPLLAPVRFQGDIVGGLAGKAGIIGPRRPGWVFCC